MRAGPGFTYAPSDAVYWQHGHSTEQDFIYVTTQTLTRDQIGHLSDEVGPNRSLLVLCSAFRARNIDQFPNLTVKKIPRTVLHRCEWGRDDYSLQIRALPAAERGEPPVPEVPSGDGSRAKRSSRTPSLFGDEPL